MVTRRDDLRMAGLALPESAAHGAGGLIPKEKKRYLILSRDGGGIRGLLTARIIERLQMEVPFLDQVELFDGTSTGGIIALGLADKVPPGTLVKMYRERTPKIFDKSEPKPPPAKKLWPLFAALNEKREEFLNGLQMNPQDIFHPKYHSEGLSSALTDYFGSRALAE
jgi:patatin-like phospholipase/acyl hydrolase